MATRPRAPSAASRQLARVDDERRSTDVAGLRKEGITPGRPAQTTRIERHRFRHGRSARALGARPGDPCRACEPSEESAGRLGTALLGGPASQRGREAPRMSRRDSTHANETCAREAAFQLGPTLRRAGSLDRARAPHRVHDLRRDTDRFRFARHVEEARSGRGRSACRVLGSSIPTLARRARRSSNNV